MLLKFIFIVVYLIRNIGAYHLLKLQFRNPKSPNLFSILGLVILVPVPYYLLSLICKSGQYAEILNTIKLIVVDLIFSVIILLIIFLQKKKY